MIKQIVMRKEPAKNEGPSCACGKVDLYEEMLKNEKKKGEAFETNPSDQTEDSSNSDDTAG